MIVGEVTAEREAFVHVTVENASGNHREVQAVLDTGFNGALALPPDLIETLGLMQRGDTVVRLASGEQRRILTYRSVVDFGGERQSVTIAEAGEALAGMALLWGRAVRMECRPNGTVALEAL